MSIKNARTLGIRLDEHDASILQRYEMETTMEGVGLARAALKAALKFYEANGQITVPLKIVPATPEIPAYLREDDIKYPVPQASGKKRVS
jgi:hypothetical protein